MRGCRWSKHVCLPVTKYQVFCSFLGAHLSTACHKKSCYTYFEICFLINNVALVVYEKKFYSQWVLIIICGEHPPESFSLYGCECAISIR